MTRCINLDIFFWHRQFAAWSYLFPWAVVVGREGSVNITCQFTQFTLLKHEEGTNFPFTSSQRLDLMMLHNFISFARGKFVGRKLTVGDMRKEKSVLSHTGKIYHRVLSTAHCAWEALIQTHLICEDNFERWRCVNISPYRTLIVMIWKLPLSQLLSFRNCFAIIRLRSTSYAPTATKLLCLMGRKINLIKRESLHDIIHSAQHIRTLLNVDDNEFDKIIINSASDFSVFTREWKVRKSFTRLREKFSYQLRQWMG